MYKILVIYYFITCVFVYLRYATKQIIFWNIVDLHVPCTKKGEARDLVVHSVC